MKIPEFFKSRTNVSLSFAGLLVVLFLCLQLSSCFHEKSVDSAVNQQTTDAARQIGINEQSTENANVSQAARQSEDIVREKVIRPKLEEIRRRSQNSKIELERANQKFNDAKNNLHNINSSRADNCQRLRELFPNERFEYCHD